MKVSDVLGILNREIIPSVKWKNDPSGLLVGKKNSKVEKILTVLNPTLRVAEEAKENGCNLIVSHHPLFKKPVNDLVEGDYYSDIIRYLIKNDISLISFHTNFDLAKRGVSFLLAKELGLKNIRPLIPLSAISDVETNELYKMVVYCPEKFAEKIKSEIDRAGGGCIGKYDHCYFSAKGTGNFRPGDGTNPFIGKEGTVESVNEIRIETVVQEWNKDQVESAVRSAHPYEEPVIDFYPLVNESGSFGLGAIGEMNKKMTLRELALFVSKKLGTGTLRIASDGRNQKVSKIAVCGGSGSSSWKFALNNGADVFITSEFNHHMYQEASYFINIIDATHHATEQFAKKGLKECLVRSIPEITILESSRDTDVVKGVNEI